MKNSLKSTTIATGLAMFSMFFGAGNVVFPLALGQIAQDKNIVAMAGMLISAIGVPFLGLISMTLFDGNYRDFFGRIGKVPGFLLALIIMGLIGPFGAIPRCITLAYSTVQFFLPDISLILFSAFSCAVILMFTIKRRSIIDTLGYILTPLLLFSLGVIILKGIFFAPEITETETRNFDLFLKGLNDGYQTMDLLGAFFFSSVVIMGLKNAVGSESSTPKKLIFTALKASGIAAFLLSLIYIGFSSVASYHSAALENATADQLISQISLHLLGPYAALVACIAVALACLTTAIALVAVFAEFVHKDVSCHKISYRNSLLITLAITFGVSTLHFGGIAAFLTPILQICYPTLILLSVLNLLYKLYQFKPVKGPVLLVLLLSLGMYFWV